MTVSNLKRLVYSHCLRMNSNMKTMNAAADHLRMYVPDSTKIELLGLLGFGYVNIKYLIQRLEGTRCTRCRIITVLSGPFIFCFGQGSSCLILCSGKFVS